MARRAGAAESRRVPVRVHYPDVQDHFANRGAFGRTLHDRVVEPRHEQLEGAQQRAGNRVAFAPEIGAGPREDGRGHGDDGQVDGEGADSLQVAGVVFGEGVSGNESHGRAGPPSGVRVWVQEMISSSQGYRAASFSFTSMPRPGRSLGYM